MVLQNFAIPRLIAYGTGCLLFVQPWPKESNNFKPKWVHWHNLYSLTLTCICLFGMAEIYWTVGINRSKDTVLIGKLFWLVFDLIDSFTAIFTRIYFLLNGKRIYFFLKRLDNFLTPKAQPQSLKCRIWFLSLLVSATYIGVVAGVGYVRANLPLQLGKAVRSILFFVLWSNGHALYIVGFCLLVSIVIRLGWIYESLSKELEIKIVVNQVPGLGTSTLVWKVEEIKDLLKNFNTLCGPIIISQLSTSLVILFTELYRAVSGTYVYVYETPVVCLQILLSLNGLLSLLELGHWLNGKISKSQLQLKPSEMYFLRSKIIAANRDLHDSWSRLLDFKWKMSPCGIFHVDRSTILGIMKTGLTLTIVLLEARESDGHI